MPIFEVFITRAAQQIIQNTPGDPFKGKGKGISFDPISLMKLSRKSEGWSQDQINQAIKESL